MRSEAVGCADETGGGGLLRWQRRANGEVVRTSKIDMMVVDAATRLCCRERTEVRGLAVLGGVLRRMIGGDGKGGLLSKIKQRWWSPWVQRTWPPELMVLAGLLSEGG